MTMIPQNPKDTVRWLAAVRQEVAAEKRRRSSPLCTLFPDEGPFRRELYPKHMEFFRAGAQYSERLFMAANRVGKTVAGALETAFHLTGRYPKWWEGRRFEKPTQAWACGSTSQTTRDVVQAVLLGNSNSPGMILEDDIVNRAAGRGIGSVETVWVRHISGGQSQLGFKSYEQGRRAFEGAVRDFVWCDEESPIEVYTEMRYRLLTTKGILFTTFTPILGMSEVVCSFWEEDKEGAPGSKYGVQAGWNDVPHLDEEEKRKLEASTPLHERKARTEGEPALGVGAVYPINESDILVPDFTIPADWPLVYGLDVGWNLTAAVWAALDPKSGVIYLYSEHYLGQGEPPTHAYGIRKRGDWIPGVIDPACLSRSQTDGSRLMDMYRKLGLNLTAAENSVEAGIIEVRNLLTSGTLKVMESLAHWRKEYRNYHRDEKGNIVKRNDHLMDATRYLIVSGRRLMRTKPKPIANSQPVRRDYGDRGWMA
jgi:phage terminase large subunit-like protein